MPPKKDKKDKGAKGGKEEAPEENQFDGLSIDVKNIKTIVLNLSTAEEDVLARCCQACFNYAMKGPEKSVDLMNLGALSYLRKLINHPDVPVRRNAGMAFGMMSGVPQIRDFLAKEQDTLIVDLTKLVQDEDPIVAEFAVATIANLSTRYMLKESLVEAQSLPHIVKLVSSSDPDTKKHALVTLKSLCNDPEVLAELGPLDAVRVVLDQLTSEFPLIQQLSLEVVYCLLQENVSRNTVTSGPLLENFVFFIENHEFSDLHCYALRCIGTCMKDPKVVQNFKETGMLVRVIEAIKLAEGNFSDETSIFFCNMVAKFGKATEEAGSAVLRPFIEANMMDLVVKMLTQADTLKCASCRAIRTLAIEPSFRDIASDNGLILKLIGLLNAENIEVRRFVILALAQLVHFHPKNRGIIFTNDVIKTVLPMMSIQDDDLVVGILSLLTSISNDDQAHQEAIECELFSKIRDMLPRTRSADIHRRSLQTITLYARCARTRDNLLKANLLPYIIKLLSSRDRQTRITASNTIISLCKDSNFATKIVDANCLAELQKVNLDPHLKSNASRCCFETILDFHLPAKLALLGILHQSDHIPTGFYYTGIVAPDALFEPLEALENEKINDKRPTLLINFENNEESDVKEIDDEASQKDPSSTPDGSRQKRSKSSKKDKSKESKETKEPKELKEVEREPKTERIASSMKLTSSTSKISLASEVEESSGIDDGLSDLIETAKSLVLKDDSYETHVRVLGELVAKTLGGEISKQQVRKIGYEMHIVELKRARASNVIPLGSLKLGLYRERALLFKLLADLTGVPATLELGDYGRAWNSVHLNNYLHIVDLMESPGSVLKDGSAEFIDYLEL